MTRLLPVLLGLLLAAALLCLPSSRLPRTASARLAATGNVLYAWTELGERGAIIARAVVDAGGECPAAVADGRPLRMTPRPNPDPALFPVQVCDAAIPHGTHAAAVGAIALPLPVDAPRRILVVGDTGCRIEVTDTSRNVQNCNDPDAWPTARVMASAAQLQPDLIIHVGDYIYREDECPEDAEDQCGGSPAGHGWAPFEADVLQPFLPLLDAAPWVFVRGNHESCDRGGQAWFYLLDPRPEPPTCQDFSEPYAIPIGGLQLVVFDSANANDTKVDQATLPEYTREISRIAELAGADAWLLTHRPVYAIRHDDAPDGSEQLTPLNLTEQAAASGRLPAGVQLIISGHIHDFEAFGFAGARVPQLVVGESGTKLRPAVMQPLDGLSIDGARVAHGVSIDRFGFVALDRGASSWMATVYDKDGGAIAACEVKNRDIACTPR